MKLCYARDAVWTPWKNGGGVTRQIAAWPEHAGLDDFGWRISTARVDVAGPFSHFAGIDRTLAVIEGALDFSQDNQHPVLLIQEGPAVSFAGEAPISGGPVGGSVTDFNLMTRRGHYSHVLSRRRLAAGEPLHIAGDRGRWTTAYVVRGNCRVEGHGPTSVLRGGDAVLVDEADAEATLSGIEDSALIIAEVWRSP